MSTQQSPLTYEGVLEMFREVRVMFQETDRKLQESAEQIRKNAEQAEATRQAAEATRQAVYATNLKVGRLDSRVGEMVEKLLGEGNLVAQFRDLGHRVKRHSRNMIFGERGTAESGEIDLFMEDGDVAILVEAKTTLKMDHVVDHIKRLEKYRRFVDADGTNSKRFIGAVAGTVISENVINFAHDNGLYVIIQSARAVEIIAQPEGFRAKEW